MTVWTMTPPETTGSLHSVMALTYGARLLGYLMLPTVLMVGDEIYLDPEMMLQVLAHGPLEGVDEDGSSDHWVVHWVVAKRIFEPTVNRWTLEVE